MRRGRKRLVVAASAALAVCLAVAVIGATAGRSNPAGAPQGSDAPASMTVTAPAGPLGVPTDPPAAGPLTAMTAGMPSGGDATSSVDPYSLENTAPEVSVSEDTTPWPAPPVDPTAAVAAAVATGNASGVQQAVVVIDRNTGGALSSVDADQPFPALSLVKLMIAADVLHGGDGGEGAGDGGVGDSGEGNGMDGGPDPAVADSAAAPALDETTLARVREMIVRSDDVTASDLYEEHGGDRLIERVVQRYGLTGSTPTPDGQYWGNVQTTAADMASLVDQLLDDPVTAPVIGPAMLATSAIAEDGVDQRIGVRTVPGAGSKQGWGCCLSGVVGIHSAGFTADRIVVVLSGAEPDDDSLGQQDGLALQADPGAQVSIAAVNATVRAALGGPAS